MTLDQYKSLVIDIGCLICGDTPELHHPREGRGMGQRADDWAVVPLCPLHHRLGTGFTQPSVHGAPRDFYSKYQRTDMGMVSETVKKVFWRL